MTTRLDVPGPLEVWHGGERIAVPAGPACRRRSCRRTPSARCRPTSWFALRAAAESGCRLGEVHALVGVAAADPGDAAAPWTVDRAVEPVSTMGARMVGARALAVSAEVRRVHGDEAAARSAAEAALAVRRHGYRSDEARTLPVLGRLADGRRGTGAALVRVRGGWA
ncbi:hypothetical protein LZG04_35310 [Saccharothrix sp. S26]|uniref:hypothetical protein n=1 Tax=Saccharothrix sp. S26 TaxID=2907215 RepID=UPI001F339C0E|nr:hypothetical protein [Saccharothrix sp. S26]MCE7000047.1 hypothetical protein [Saccharothrix sp. S26]